MVKVTFFTAAELPIKRNVKYLSDVMNVFPAKRRLLWLQIGLSIPEIGEKNQAFDV